MSLLHTSEILWKKSELSKMSFQEKIIVKSTPSTYRS